MKKMLPIILITIILLSCKKKRSDLDIIFSKIENQDSTSISLNGLILKNSDSVFLKLQRPYRINFKDTIKVNNIPTGKYTVEYVDIIGNKILKSIEINENQKEVKFSTDSINTEEFKNKIPFTNLKNNDSYTIEMKGGCIASFYGYYKVSRNNNEYYFESIGVIKKIVNQSEINAIKKFESELLAIDGKEICLSTGRMTFQIKSSISKEITDNTCNWNGWSNLFRSFKFTNPDNTNFIQQ